MTAPADPATAAPPSRRCTGRRAFLRLAPLAPALLLGACMVGPDYHGTTAPVPTGWAQAGGAATAGRAQLAQWWTKLGDPVLDGLVRTAVAGNLDVKTAEAAVREARASYREAGGADLPQLDASASGTRSRSGTGSSGFGGGTGNLFDAGFDASWEIDIFGGNRRSVQAAGYAAQAAEADLGNALVTLVGEVASDYVTARGYQARIALARRTAASQRQTQSLTEAMFKAGSSSALDVANAKGQAASTEATIPDLQASYVQTVHALSVLTGQTPDALATLLARPKPVPQPRLPIPAGIPADVLSARPDVRAAERRLAQSTASIGVAEANRYPSISLTGSIDTSAGKLGDVVKASSIGWSWGPNVSIPLFHGGALKAAVDVAKAERDQQFIAYRASVLTALQDVEDALVALSQERRKYAKLGESAAAYRQAESLSRSLFRSGSITFLDLLDAERSLYSAEDSLIQSRVNIATDYIALNKGLGGGWGGAAATAAGNVAKGR